jgi:hypothetical protein
MDLVVGEGQSQESMLSAYRVTGSLVEIRGLGVTLP